MDIQSLSTDEVSSLVDHLLKAQDPAAVALRRILKKKEQLSDGFPLQTMRFDEFRVQGKTGSTLSDEERRVIELEKRNADLVAGMEARKRDAEEAVRQAFQKGLSEGLAKGEKIARERCDADYEKRLSAVQERFAAALKEFDRARRDMVLDSQHALAKLSCALARKVILTELSVNPDVVLQVVRRALTYIADRENLVLRVCKDDLETVTGKQDFWKPVGERLDRITIMPDEHVDKGGCILESDSGVADARPGVQIAELESLVEQVWEGLRQSAVASPAPVGSSPEQDAHGSHT